MRLSLLPAVLTAILVVATATPIAFGAARSSAATNQAGNTKTSKAARVKNPVAATAASIQAGHTVYDKLCAACHGETGKGDGSMGDQLSPRPSDLTDSEWKHGPTDGDIYTLIRGGVKGTGMKAYGRRLTTHQVWDVVNYIRSLGPAKSQ
jgi:mono/diheme cytochrome c family protein